MSSKVRDWLSKWWDQPRLDIWATLGIVAVAVGAWFAAGYNFDLLGRLRLQQRNDFYSLLANVAGIIFGFTTAALGFFYTTDHERLAFVRAKGGKNVGVNFLHILITLLVVLAVFVAAMVVEGPVEASGADPATGNLLARYVAQVAMVAMALRLVRLAWLFSHIVVTVSTDTTESSFVGTYSGPFETGPPGEG